MEHSPDIKEKIIQTSTALLLESGGKPEHITIRAIAARAGIGIGLVHYHFGSKEKLIETCVQRIIQDVILRFRPPDIPGAGRLSRLQAVAKQVADFLVENPQISRISILGDMGDPAVPDNTMKTVEGFQGVLGVRTEEAKRALYVFTLALQGLFLRKDVPPDAAGLDLNVKSDRDKLIEWLLEKLLKGIVYEDPAAERDAP